MEIGSIDGDGTAIRQAGSGDGASTSSHRRSVGDLLMAALAGAAPLLALIGLAWSTAVEEVEHALGRVTQETLAAAERVIASTDTILSENIALSGLPCEAPTIERLRAIVYDAAYLREIGLMSDKAVIYCTNFGRTRIDLTIGRNPEVPPGKLTMFATTGHVMRRQSLIMNRREADGRGINALINPALIGDLLDRYASEIGGYLSLRLTDGTAIHATSKGLPVDSDQLPSVVRASRGYPIEVQGWARRGAHMAAFLDRLPLFAVLGLALGVVTGLLTRRVLRGQATMVAGLTQAVSRGELEVHYHPVIELATGRCVGAEALMRWRHPRHGLIRPDLFIPTAEETGLIVPMTRWLVDRVRREMATVDRLPTGFVLSINCSAQHLPRDALLEDLAGLTRDSAAPGPGFAIEVTEREEIEPEMLAALTRLRAAGFQVALDDFGTGHCGLSVLRDCRIDVLKLDRSFTAMIGTDAVGRPIVDSVIDVARRFDLKVIAEGVETEAQRAYLRDQGVTEAQGFLFARPMPIEAFKDYLSQSGRVAASM